MGTRLRHRLLGGNYASSMLCKISYTSKLTRWSTPRPPRIAVGQRIKLENGDFSFGRTMYAPATPRTQSNPRAGSGSSIVFTDCCDLRASRARKKGALILRKPRFAARRGRSLDDAQLTLRPTSSGQYRPCERISFLGIFRKSPDRAKNAPELILERNPRTRQEPPAMVGLPAIHSPHSFRVVVVTTLFSQNGLQEDVQYLAGYGVDPLSWTHPK